MGSEVKGEVEETQLSSSTPLSLQSTDLSGLSTTLLSSITPPPSTVFTITSILNRPNRTNVATLTPGLNFENKPPSELLLGGQTINICSPTEGKTIENSQINSQKKGANFRTENEIVPLKQLSTQYLDNFGKAYLPDTAMLNGPCADECFARMSQFNGCTLARTSVNSVLCDTLIKENWCSWLRSQHLLLLRLQKQHQPVLRQLAEPRGHSISEGTGIRYLIRRTDLIADVI